MTLADIESRVVKIVAQKLGVDKDLVTSDASFEGDLGAGEFDMAEMISLFETESEIEAAVITVVAEKMGVDEDDISGDTRFTEDLNADSLRELGF